MIVQEELNNFQNSKNKNVTIRQINLLAETKQIIF